MMLRPTSSLFLTLLLTGVCLPAEEKKVTFDEHIKPIFREHCTACHSESDKESDLALDSYSGTLAGGSSGEVIAQNNVGSSRLFQLVTHAERPFMPPDQDPIPKKQIELLRTWIDQGMPENSGSEIKRVNTAAAAMLQNTSIGKPEGPPPMPESLLREPVLETPRAAAISAMAASPWAPLIAVGGQQQVSLYHAESSELLGVLPFPEGEPQVLQFTRDGKQLLIAGGKHSHSGSAVLVDIVTGKRIAKVGDELDVVLAADISPDKSRIAIAGPQKIIRIFDTFSGEIAFELKKHTDWIYTLRFSPDGVLLASGDRSNGLLVWEADTGNIYADLTGHKGEVRSVDFRSDSNVLASGSLDGTVKLWDMFESKQIQSWNAHAGGVTDLGYTHQGFVASAGRDRRVKLWDGTGKLQKEFKSLSDAVLEVAITGDGDFIAGGDWNGQVNVWPTSDPDTTLLVKANPPSIERRLSSAQEKFTNAEQVAGAAAEAAKLAEQAAEKAEQFWQNADKTVRQFEQELQDLSEQSQKLKARLTDEEEKIRQLEMQLALHRKQRDDTRASLQEKQKSHSELQVRVQQANQERAKRREKHEKSMSAATEAATKLEDAEQELQQYRLAYEKAKADKVALDARAKAVSEAAQVASSRVATLAEQLEKSEVQQQAQQNELAANQTQLQELQQQLRELQQRVDQALRTQSAAQSKLTNSQQEKARLKAELEAAQQAALDAQEQLELFEKSYR